MQKQISIASALSCALTLFAGQALAANPAPERVQTPQAERVYGSDLMTEQERAEQRARIRAAETAEERERIRNEHHERMEERARSQGSTLPADPPAGAGSPWGSGRGAGPGGGGSGPGGGRGR
jgi:hypothetical protein